MLHAFPEPPHIRTGQDTRRGFGGYTSAGHARRCEGVPHNPGISPETRDMRNAFPLRKKKRRWSTHYVLKIRSSGETKSSYYPSVKTFPFLFPRSGISVPACLIRHPSSDILVRRKEVLSLSLSEKTCVTSLRQSIEFSSVKSGKRRKISCWSYAAIDRG